MSTAGGGGLGEGGAWGGGCYRRYERLARTRTHTCQCTQVDAWSMLVADAGKKWRASYVHPSKHEFARKCEEQSSQMTRLLHSGGSM